MRVDAGDGVSLAAKAAAAGLGEEPRRVTPLVGRGSVNRVFVVETATRRVVVRMSGRGRAPDEYAKEAWCMERAAARGVLVPSVVGLGRCEGEAYIILSYVEGDEGRESPAPKAAVWRELGRHARLIHSIPVNGLGLELSEIVGGDARASWLRHLAYNVESLTADDPLIGLGVLTRPQSGAIRRVFDGLRGRDFSFGLNHGDLSLKNAVVGANGRVTLLDWGEAEAAAVPHHDLIELLKMNMSEGDPGPADLSAFLDGYGLSATEFTAMMPELSALLALRAFDKLRWALDRGVENVWEYVGHARAAAARCLAGISSSGG